MKYLIIGKNKLSDYIFEEISGCNEVKRIIVDATNIKYLKNEFDSFQPDLVFHFAELNDVDTVESCQELAYFSNYLVTEHIVNLCKESGCELLYLSNAYVFDGKKLSAYEINDKTNPINYYGKLKVLSENVIKTLKKFYIVRTGWLFDEENYNFINQVFMHAMAEQEMRVVTDQIGCPTYSKDLVPLLLEIISTNIYGTYHATCDDSTSKYDFAKYICDINGLPNILIPTKTCDLNYTASRPLNQVLDTSKMYEMGFELPDWQDGVLKFNEDFKKLIRK